MIIAWGCFREMSERGKAFTGDGRIGVAFKGPQMLCPYGARGGGDEGDMGARMRPPGEVWRRVREECVLGGMWRGAEAGR